MKAAAPRIVGPYPFSPNCRGRRNTTAHPRQRARRVLHYADLMCQGLESRTGYESVMKMIVHYENDDCRMIAQPELLIYMFYSDLRTQVLPCPLLLRRFLLPCWRSTSLTETILEALADVLHITARRSLGSLYPQRNHNI